MSAVLRQVLTIFETHHGSLSLQQMAKTLNVEPGLLEGMIDYWVRKGKIREVVQAGDACHSCGTSNNGCHGCPFIVQMPRCYELVTGEAANPTALKLPPQSCCH